MNLIFSAGSIDECLEKASDTLKINKNDLKYKIIKEERKFFRKKITIEIQNKDLEDNNKENSLRQDTTNRFGAQVKDGKIIVTPFDNDEIITIKGCEGVRLILNGEETNIIEGAKITDNIEYVIEESQQAERTMEISVSKNKMEAYLSIKSVPQRIYKLEDCELRKNLVLKRVLVEKKYAPQYTPEDIRNALKEKNVVFGVLDDVLKRICDSEEVICEVVAKGVQAINSTPEELEILFKDYDQLKENADTNIKVDYRNRFMLATVKVGEQIARVISSKPGKNGRDVYGNDVKYKEYLHMNFKIGEGCKYEDDKILATIEGKPSFKGNTFRVHKVYQVEEVNLGTGNINFVADVEISKTVDEGMEVVAGNTVFVGKNVESAKITASSDITVRGNIINSTVVAGDYSFNKKKYLLNLNNAKNMVHKLYSAVMQINNNNSILEGRKVGELIKLLIENKYKALMPLCREIIEYCSIQGVHDSPVTAFINNKLIGFGPLNIICEDELLNFIDLLSEECEELQFFDTHDANIYAEYIQASKLESMGSIFINGKGQYNSEITALNNIEFVHENSVCRGGLISAGKEIKLKTVGSEAGVNTILKVSKDGVITADIAYSNTVFCIGEKQIVLEVSSRSVKVYMDKMGDIEIDKLLL
ncbi:DUF342 domain-containing protein [Clostridium butyricum]|uniref:RNA-binding protein KhpB N-terminal domain-containing protein n=1 Tax=Clostridium butyricum TaxID=1492 RepID=A0A0A6PYT8_CLOBU|nr:FapA family protein [Clostridium butyricum]KHD13353.1 hypothetical protein OA81_21295 [Clostridium butyricum]KHD15833.1 hypothetical protein OA81_08335 [Clostridium butyricum]PPV14628.1 hypothetical protein AWN73_02640 [Clostridium butyricum]